MSFIAELKRRNVFRAAVAYSALAWLLVQLVNTVSPLFGFGMGPARAAVIVAIAGFIPAMIIAWMYDLTPEGLRKEQPASLDYAPTPYARHALDRAIMVALALAVAYFALDKFLFSAGKNPVVTEFPAASTSTVTDQATSTDEVSQPPSIAVLAFVDMSREQDQEYLGDGIAEELLNVLTRIPGLRVISRSSAFSYKNQPVRVEQIARELNVGYLLEGSVRRSANQVRVTAQLVDARTDTHLWSQTYDRSLDDIFIIQDEIAAEVVSRLEVTLFGERPRVEITDPAAYTLMLQARHLLNQGTTAGYEQAIALYQQALEIVPDHPGAWVGLATSYSNQASKGLRDPAEGIRLAREADLKALAIDPDYAPALGHLGWLSMFTGNDLGNAASYLERALQQQPASPGIIGNAATLLHSLGRVEQATPLNEFLASRDPVNPTNLANLAYGYLATGRLQEAIDTYAMVLRLSPDRLAVHFHTGLALLRLGDPAAALQQFDEEPFELLGLLGKTMAWHSLGDPTRSDTLLDELIVSHERDAAYNIAYVQAWRGDVDAAFNWLQKAVEYDDPGLVDIASDPLFRPLHQDARWVPFLGSIGMAPEQLDTIAFRVSLPVEGYGSSAGE